MNIDKLKKNLEIFYTQHKDYIFWGCLGFYFGLLICLFIGQTLFSEVFPTTLLIGWSFIIVVFFGLLGHATFVGYKQNILKITKTRDKVSTTIAYLFLSLMILAAFVGSIAGICEDAVVKIKRNNYITSERYVDSVRIADSSKKHMENIKNTILSDFRKFFNVEFSGAHYNKPIFTITKDRVRIGFRLRIGNDIISSQVYQLDSFYEVRKDYCSNHATSTLTKTVSWSEYSSCTANLDVEIVTKDTFVVDTSFANHPMVIDDETISIRLENPNDSIVRLKIEEYLNNSIDWIFVSFRKKNGEWEEIDKHTF